MADFSPGNRASPKSGLGEFEPLRVAIANWNGSATSAANIAASICASALNVLADYRQYDASKLNFANLCRSLAGELGAHASKPTTDQKSLQMLRTFLRQLPLLNSTDSSGLIEELDKIKTWVYRIRIVQGLEYAFRESHGLSSTDASAAMLKIKDFEVSPATNQHTLENLGDALYFKMASQSPGYRLPPSAVKILGTFVNFQNVDNTAAASLIVDAIQSIGPVVSEQFATLLQNSINVGYRLTLYPGKEEKRESYRKLRTFFSNIFKDPHASFERCNWQLLREEYDTYRRSPVLDEFYGYTARIWFEIAKHGQQVVFRSSDEQAVCHRYQLTFSDRRLSPQMASSFPAAEKAAYERLKLVQADVLAAFDSFEFDARHAALGRESVIERFAKWASLRTPRASQAARFSYPGPGLVFDFGQLTEQLSLADPMHVGAVAKSVHNLISAPMLDELPLVSIAALQGQFAFTFPNLSVLIGGEPVQYAVQFCNSHIPGVVGATMRLVPAACMPVLTDDAHRGAVLSKRELQQFHPYSIAAEAGKFGLPAFDFFHHASLLTGAAHPVCVDKNLRCHVEHPRMSHEDWLSVGTAAEQGYQMMRIFQFALGYFKVITRVNHTFRDGRVMPVDLMLSELLAWHEWAQSKNSKEFSPLLRFAPFHFRRSLYSSSSTQNDPPYASDSSPLGIVIDSASLRMNPDGRCPGSEYIARIWLRAHGMDLGGADAAEALVEAWENKVVPILIDKNQRWTGIEPRFMRAALPADRHYG